MSDVVEFLLKRVLLPIIIIIIASSILLTLAFGEISTTGQGVDPLGGFEWGVPVVINPEPPVNPDPFVIPDDPTPIPIPEPEPEPPSFADEWNTSGEGDPDGGDPLVFGNDVSVIRNWSEQHESFLTEFDLYNTGQQVILSRTLGSDTYTIFLDINNDNILSDGREWLFDTEKDVYEILQILDTDSNGFFDYKDDNWSILKIKYGNHVTPITATGIIGFNWSDAIHYDNDPYGKGQYSDCLYEGVMLFPDCNPVSDSHFRLASYNEKGMYIIGGEVHPTYGIIMGHLKDNHS